MFTRAVVDERLDGKRNPRPRTIPVLPILRETIDRRLADMAGAQPDSFLLALTSPWDSDPRGFVETSARHLTEASGDRVKSLVDLAQRYKAYLNWGAVEPDQRVVVAWMSGLVGRKLAKAVPGFRPHLDYEPELPEMARILRAKHPSAA